MGFIKLIFIFFIMSNFVYDLNGDLLVFGENSCGQLGLSHNKNIIVPTLLISDKSIKNIIYGGLHTIAHKKRKSRK